MRGGGSSHGAVRQKKRAGRWRHLRILSHHENSGASRSSAGTCWPMVFPTSTTGGIRILRCESL